MITLLSLMLLAGEPAQATPGSEPAAQAEKKEEKLVCRTKVTDTGSRMRKKVCMTQAQWDRKDSGQNFDDMKRVGN